MSDWVLVVPCSLTLSQTEWFDGLGASAPGAALRFWDESRLDDLLTEFADVYGYVRRDDTFFEKARVLGLERAVLADPAADITTRLKDLQALANTVDPDFFVNMYADGDGVRLTAAPKHGQATQFLNTKFKFPVGYEHYLDQLLELVNYGITEEVVLPPQVIVSVDLRGPAFLHVETPDATRQTLTFGPQAEPEPITLRILNEHQETAGTHPGLVRITGGQQGVKLTAVFHEALHITWRIPLNETGEQPATQFTLSPAGCLPANVVAACRLLRQVLTCPQLDILVKGTSNRLTTRDPHMEVPLRADIVQTTAEDLEAVQRATETYFTYPQAISVLDRIHLRVCRMLCEGRTVMAPTPFTVQLELDEQPPLAATPGPLWLDGQQITFRVGEDEVALNGITVWHPAGWIRPNPESGGDNATYVVEPRSERFILSPDGSAMYPEPWGLVAVTEPDTPVMPDGLFSAE